MKTPFELWRIAREAHPTDETARALLYVALMRQVGHITTEPMTRRASLFGCGYDPRRFGRGSEEEERRLAEDVAVMASNRRRAEVEARNIFIG